MKKNAVALSITTFALAFLAACSTPVPKDNGMNNQPSAGSDQGGSGVVTVNGNADSSAIPPEVANARSVFFDYDSFIVKDDSRPAIVTNANFLKRNPGRHVILQGNTDERGGSEFNLALGQKRAEAVRKQLTLLGVADSQLEAVSFGKEKPMAQGHDESSWAQNRRADFQY